MSASSGVRYQDRPSEDQPSEDRPSAAGPAKSRSSESRSSGVTALGRNRDFRLLWLGQASSGLGTSMSGVAMPLFALVLTGSEVLAGVLSTVAFMVMMVAAMPGGYLADRFDGRRLMMLCDAVRALAMASVAVAALLGVASIWHLLVAVVVATVADMAFGPTVSKAMRSIVPREQIPVAVSVSQARAYAADMVGPSAGGALFATGRAVPFVADAVSFVVSLTCVARLRTNLTPAEPVTGPLRFFPAVAAGWRHVWRDAFLRNTTLYSAAMNIAVSTLLFVLILGEGGGPGGSVVVGVALSFAAAGGLAGSFIAPLVRGRVSLRGVLVGVAAVRTALVLMVVITGSTVALAVALASVVLLSPLIGATVGAARMLVVPPALFGRVAGTSSFIGGALQPLAPLLAGALIQYFSQQTALTVLVVVFGLVTLFALVVRGLAVPQSS